MAENRHPLEVDGRLTLDELRALATIQDGPHLRFQPPYQLMSVSLDEAEFLYALVRALKPRNVLELGSGLGLSGRFIAEALPEHGWLLTVEPNADLADQAVYGLLQGAKAVVSPELNVSDTWPDLVYIDSG